MEFNATFLVSIISFILFTIIMNKIFYTPIGKIIDDRQRFIDGAYNDAKLSKEQAEELLKNRDDQLCKTSEQSKKLVANALEDANNNSKDLTSEAKKQSLAKIDDAKTQLQKENLKNQEELKSKIQELAQTISSKVMKMDAPLADVNQELIDRIIR